MKTYEIKIIGSGTKSQLWEALYALADKIECSSPFDLEGAEWNDDTLLTLISLEYDSDK